MPSEFGYDWARHSGATFFLAQAAALTGDPTLIDACRRAATLLRGPAMNNCGGNRCVGDEQVVFLGSSALALLAFTEIVEKKSDESYRSNVVELTKFLRSQQRQDGEFMHEYDRQNSRPIDYQYLYYSSEASLALARAYAITQDKADLVAALRGLRNLVGVAWTFFGDRYYVGEEHWTCQAMAVLWKHAPEPDALDFCLRWQEFSRALQQREGDSYFDADGAIGVSPVVTPRLTPVASRCEAAVATLDVAKQAGVDAREVACWTSSSAARSRSCCATSSARARATSSTVRPASRERSPAARSIGSSPSTTRSTPAARWSGGSSSTAASCLVSASRSMRAVRP